MQALVAQITRLHNDPTEATEIPAEDSSAATPTALKLPRQAWQIGDSE